MATIKEKLDWLIEQLIERGVIEDPSVPPPEPPARTDFLGTLEQFRDALPEPCTIQQFAAAGAATMDQLTPLVSSPFVAAYLSSIADKLDPLTTWGGGWQANFKSIAETIVNSLILEINEPGEYAGSTDAELIDSIQDGVVVGHRLAAAKFGAKSWICAILVDEQSALSRLSLALGEAQGPGEKTPPEPVSEGDPTKRPSGW